MPPGSEQKLCTIADDRAKNKPRPMLMKNNRIGGDRIWRILDTTTRWPVVPLLTLPPDLIIHGCLFLYTIAR